MLKNLLPTAKIGQILNGIRKNSSLKIDLEEENLNNNGFVKAKLEEEVEDDDDNKLHYGLEDTPPWYTCLVLGFQVRLSINVYFF